MHITSKAVTGYFLAYHLRRSGYPKGGSVDPILPAPVSLVAEGGRRFDTE